jgi:CRISPR system Cascade subunit CasB
VEHPGKAWRFTALALVAALAAQVKTIDDRQTFAAQLGQKTGDTPVMSRLRFARLSAVKTPMSCCASCVAR